MRHFFLILIAFLSFSTQAEDIVLVANTKLSKNKISVAKLKNLYLGTPIFDGIEPVQLTVGHPSRSKFDTFVIGMTEARIAGFWAQMRFSGTRLPPKSFDNEQQLIEYMQKNENVIGYLPKSSTVPHDFFVLKEL